jgi:hypothetical protein
MAPGMLSACRAKRSEMRKIRWLIGGGVAAAALAAAVAMQGVASATPNDGQQRTDPASVLRFGTMTPVTGPFVGTANPVRGEPGGSLPWILKSAHGSLTSDGHVRVTVRGLVLANVPAVPANLRDKNPFPAYRALVSCQSIGAGSTTAVTNVSTGNFTANAEGDSQIDATVSLPTPCFAPIVFVTGPAGVDFWFAVTGA